MLTKKVIKRLNRGVEHTVRKVKYRLASIRPNPLEQAVRWFHSNRIPGGGIRPFPRNPIATQEVTGYSIPTLYNVGEKDLARDLARWETSVQNPDGSFSAIDGVPYTFDTAQVIRGFLAVLEDIPELEPNLRRACNYVDRHIAPDGKVLHESYDTWKFEDGNTLSENGNVYVLPPMLQAGKLLSEQRYIDSAKRGLDYFRKKPDLTEFKPSISTISHYLGYITEALIDLGEIELAKEGLRQGQVLQAKNGAIPAYPSVEWFCSTGMAQVAISWYKIGDPQPADRAMEYLETMQ